MADQASLMRKPSLKWDSWVAKGINTFFNDIRAKMNLIARLEFELAYYDVAV